MRLSPGFRYTIYTSLTVLFVTGALWLVADRLKDSVEGELWQSVAANLLMLHGGAAMAALLLFGALFPVHIRMSWQLRKNRATGIVMLTTGMILIVTAFGLYYAGTDLVRPWISWTHIGAGVAVPALAVVHIVTGRRRR